MDEIDPGYRLPPLRQIRLYARIARAGMDRGDSAGIGLSLAAIKNVQDAIARLQEHHVR